VSANGLPFEFAQSLIGTLQRPIELAKVQLAREFGISRETIYLHHRAVIGTSNTNGNEIARRKVSS
jgi:hypothetical protein